MKKLRTVSLTLILLATTVSPAAASPILVYNNFGDPSISGHEEALFDPSTQLAELDDQASEPDNSSEVFGADGPSIEGSSVGVGFSAAALSFTPTTNVTFHSLEVAVEVDPGSLIASLAMDGGGHPGAVLESFTFTGPLAPGPVVEGDSTKHPMLKAGTTYWITLFPGDSNTNGLWFLNSTGAEEFSSSSDGTNWTVQEGASPVLEVEGDPTIGSAIGAPIPEPSTLVILTLSLVGMAGYHAWQRSLGLSLALLDAR
jgi:hypothetical protein